MTVALTLAHGDTGVAVDVNSQELIDIIKNFFVEWLIGCDLVYGIRQSGMLDSTIKRPVFVHFYKTFSRKSRDQLLENIGDLRLIDRKVIELVRSMPEKNGFKAGMFSWVDFETKVVSKQRVSRVVRSTSWNYCRLWDFALDGVISFTSMPLRIWTWIEPVIWLVSFIHVAAIIARKWLLAIRLPAERRKR